MHKTRNDLPEKVRAKGVAPLQEKLAVAADCMIQPVDGRVVVPGVFIPEALGRPVASLRVFNSMRSATATMARTAWVCCINTTETRNKTFK